MGLAGTLTGRAPPVLNHMLSYIGMSKLLPEDSSLFLEDRIKARDDS